MVLGVHDHGGGRDLLARAVGTGKPAIEGAAVLDGGRQQAVNIGVMADDGVGGVVAGGLVIVQGNGDAVAEAGRKECGSLGGKVAQICHAICPAASGYAAAAVSGAKVGDAGEGEAAEMEVHFGRVLHSVGELIQHGGRALEDRFVCDV